MPPQNSSSQTQPEFWTMEPELREMPPRRFVESEFPDLNAPSRILFLGVGTPVLVIGLVLFVVGMAKHKHIFSLPGLLLTLVGLVLVVLYPTRRRSHLGRAENLVSFGTPVMARILSSDNLTGDSQFGRSVKYQVTLPGGEMAHREVNCDDRALPRRIPCDATALVDMSSGDAELYCALPYRAVVRDTAPGAAPATPRPAPAPIFVPTPASAPQPPPAAQPTTAGMATLSEGAAAETPRVPRSRRSAPAPTETPAASPASTAEPTPGTAPAAGEKPKSGTTSGLPWE